MKFSTSLDLAVAVPFAGHHVSVAPAAGTPTGVALVSLPNYLGGATILVLLVAMLGSGFSAAGFNKKQSPNRQRQIHAPIRSAHHH